jgi:hypothetical protein
MTQATSPIAAGASSGALRQATAWSALRAQWQAQPRVRAGVVLIVLIVWVYGLLESSDRLQRAERRLQQLQGELRAARVQDGDANRWALRAGEAAARLQALERELWINGSEAAAQARLRDWLLEIARSQQAGRYFVTLGNPTALRTSAAAGEPSQATRLLKASFSFDFTPATLEAVLKAIESGNRYAQVETLSVNKRARRVEMNVAVAARIESSDQPAADLGTPRAAAAGNAGVRP